MGTKGQPLGKRFYEIQAEDVKKYGEVFRNKLPSVEIISLSDPANVSKLLRSDPKYPERLEFPSLNFYREKRKEMVFKNTWFYKVYETQKFKKFFDNFDSMYDYAELFIGRVIKELEEKPCKPSKETERDRAGFFEFLLASGKLTTDDLLASVIDVLFAGVDTTSNTMQWVLYMLAKNPEKQKILRREVLSVVRDSTFARRKRSLVCHT